MEVAPWAHAVALEVAEAQFCGGRPWVGHRRRAGGRENGASRWGANGAVGQRGGAGGGGRGRRHGGRCGRRHGGGAKCCTSAHALVARDDMKCRKLSSDRLHQRGVGGGDDVHEAVLHSTRAGVDGGRWLCHGLHRGMCHGLHRLGSGGSNRSPGQRRAFGWWPGGGRRGWVRHRGHGRRISIEGAISCIVHHNGRINCRHSNIDVAGGDCRIGDTTQRRMGMEDRHGTCHTKRMATGDGWRRGGSDVGHASQCNGVNV